ncbi:hypothetical protein D918_06763 [Trichuris suis]|nr:hypothetical protein D918_06763 [Trichuris suis]
MVNCFHCSRLGCSKMSVSAFERKLVFSGISNGLRMDGRSFQSPRPITVRVNPVDPSPGSVTVCFGDCCVTAGARLELQKPTTENADQGSVDFSISMAGLSDDVDAEFSRKYTPSVCNEDALLSENLRNRKADIAYLVDLYFKFNEMNKQLQAEDVNLIKTKSVICAFMSKLLLFKRNFGRGELSQFQSLAEVRNEGGVCEADVELYCEHLQALHDDFTRRFQDILCMVIPDWVINPLSNVDDEEISLQEELLDLQSNVELKARLSQDNSMDERLENVIFHLSSAFRINSTHALKSLCVKPGVLCWHVHITILVFQYCGNLVDTCSIAANVLLHTKRIPVIDIRSAKEQSATIVDLNADPDEFLTIDMSDVPLLATVVKIGRHCLIDPTEVELSGATCSAVVGTNRQCIAAAGQICYFSKNFGNSLDFLTVVTMMNEGSVVINSIYCALMEVLSDQEKLCLEEQKLPVIEY